MSEFRCKLCGIAKPADGFYSSNKSRCKECIKESVRAHRIANIEYYRSFDKARGSMPHRVAARAAYQATPRGIEAVKRAKKEWAKRNADKRRAHNLLAKAIAKGAIHKLPCFVCGREDAEAHHPDYSAPLAVTWLCSRHHDQLHKEAREYECAP